MKFLIIKGIEFKAAREKSLVTYEESLIRLSVVGFSSEILDKEGVE